MNDRNFDGGKGHRKHARYAVPWRIVVVYKNNGKHETHRGSMCDLSLGGACFYADINIYSPDPLVVTIEIPAYAHSHKNTIVGARCIILHSILSSNYGKFRIGIRFIDFNGKGETNLQEALSKQVPIKDSAQVYK